jgi:hypothetical protein
MLDLNFLDKFSGLETDNYTVSIHFSHFVPVTQESLLSK